MSMGRVDLQAGTRLGWDGMIVCKDRVKLFGGL
jgi:hypothetical protein